MRMIALFLASLFLAAGPVRAADTLHVSAAISLKNAMEEARPVLEKAAGMPIQFTYGASGQLATQISAGAPVDLFLSADAATPRKLADKKLVEGLAPIAGNELVLIAPNTKATPLVHSFDDLAKPAVTKIAMGAPDSVPAGKYGRQVLRHLKMYDALNDAHKLVFAENVGQVLALVSRGEADAGLVYATDARSTNAVFVAARSPADSHEPIVYVGAVIKDAPHAATARATLAAITTPGVQKTFDKFGFSAPSPPTTPATAP